MSEESQMIQIGDMSIAAPTVPSGIDLLHNAGQQGFEAYYTSLPAPNPEDRHDVLRYAHNISRFMGQANYRLSETIGQVILLTDVFAHRVRVRQEVDGHDVYVPAERIVLVDSDSETYEGVSDGVFRSLYFIMSMPGIGQPPWSEPLPVVVKQIAVRNTFRTFRIEVAAPEEEKPKKSRAR